MKFLLWGKGAALFQQRHLKMKLGCGPPGEPLNACRWSCAVSCTPPVLRSELLHAAFCCLGKQTFGGGVLASDMAAAYMACHRHATTHPSSMQNELMAQSAINRARLIPALQVGSAGQWQACAQHVSSSQNAWSTQT